jgi:hypothetical protein
MEALPIGKIDLPVTFGTLRNFCTKMLTFKVVGFSGMYHAIIGRLAYVKFMTMPNYMYLKLKILGPKGVITVGLCSNTYTNAMRSVFSSLRRSSNSRGSTPNLPPRTRISSSRPIVRPGLSSLPRTSRMRLSPMTAAHSVSGWHSILNRKAHSLTSSKRTLMCLHGNPLT